MVSTLADDADFVGPAVSAFRWVTEANMQLEWRPQRWQEWIDRLRSPAEKALGLAGLAAGVARGKRPNTASAEDEVSKAEPPASIEDARRLAEAGKRREATDVAARLLASDSDKELAKDMFKSTSHRAPEWWLTRALSHAAQVNRSLSLATASRLNSPRSLEVALVSTGKV